MTKSLARVVALTLTFFVAVTIVWVLTYPSESDAKNIKYVLWKNSLYRMNIDTATGAMIGDASREKLVVGQTRAQLRERFGYLSTLAEVSTKRQNSYSLRGVEIIPGSTNAYFRAKPTNVTASKLPIANTRTMTMVVAKPATSPYRIVPQGQLLVLIISPISPIFFRFSFLGSVR